ncbi:MAG: caspase family protein [Xenococcaceae cyanobacterium MO_188.B19]|nr:caspase family protein [Xenococcaceae cyanobacterium MO_188.B19]
MGLDRRTFLQRAGLALFSLGVSETGISLLGSNNRFAPWLQAYGQTLAQTTNRKLALLIGINQYTKNKELKGCVTDVELQKELLIHRFGFLPQDILTLTDQQATRENIETAFLEHLTEQAQADDVVVFHFSGYGGRVKMPQKSIDPSKTSNYQLIESLLPADGLIPTKGNPAANDLLKDTLFDLLRSLKTDQVTTILDTGFKQTSHSLQGNFRIRSYDDVAERTSPEETAFRDQMQIKLKSQGVKSSNIPGIILSAAGAGQPALEGKWHHFSAGLFTYSLTQHLWQVIPVSKVQGVWQKTLANVALITDNNQKPQIQSKNKPLNQYYPVEQNGIAAEGLITEIDSKGVINLTLTAIPFPLLDNYGLESCFTVADSSETVQIQLKSREGIKGKGQILNSSQSPNKLVKSGQLIQESIRVLPHNVGLTVALDQSLERIERVDATSALSNISRVTNTILTGENSADCILGKVTSTSPDLSDTNSEENLVPGKSYGLFTPGGTLIAKTVGVAEEAVKLAISRLETEFSSLLATKWLQLIVNENSSLIPLEANLELSQPKNNSILLERNTRNFTPGSRRNPLKVEILPTIPQDAPLKLRLINNGESTLYSILVEVTPQGQITTLYQPPEETRDQKNATPINWEIPGKNKLVIPQVDNSWQWKTPQSKGINQLYVIVATQPFTKTLTLLSEQAKVKRDRTQIINLLEPLAVTQAILEDLHTASAVSEDIIGSNSDVYGLDSQAWAAFHFTYEIV